MLDLRSLQPLDEEAILATLAKTGRLVVDRRGDAALRDRERRRRALRRPGLRPPERAGEEGDGAARARALQPRVLEDAYVPSPERVVAAVREMRLREGRRRMPTPIAMPKLGMTMREGRVVAWPLAVGARVEKGQTVLVIESEKAEVEIEAPACRRAPPRLRRAGPDRSPCGTLLGAITGDADEPFDADAFRREHDRPDDGARRRAAARRARRAPRHGRGRAARACGRRVVTPAARALGESSASTPGACPAAAPAAASPVRTSRPWRRERERPACTVAPGVALEVRRRATAIRCSSSPASAPTSRRSRARSRSLAERFRVLAVNPRGVGLSDAPEQERLRRGRRSPPTRPRVVDAPAHVVGASLGAAVAIELALAQSGTRPLARP